MTPVVGAPPPRYPYNLDFSRAITWLSAVVLSASIAVVAWLSFDVPRVDRVPDAERALAHMVGRLMDLGEGLKTLPIWEQFLYEVTMGSDANDRAQAIDGIASWPRKSPDPLVDLHLAILEGEAGRLQDVQDKVVRWGRQSAPYPLFARFVQAGYIDGHTSPTSAFDLQAHLAEQPLTGWFYSRLAMRIAERSGDRPLLATIEASSSNEGRRYCGGPAPLPLSNRRSWPWACWCWCGGSGKGTARPCFVWALPSCRPCGRAGWRWVSTTWRRRRCAAFTVAFLFTGIEYPSLRVLAVPLSNLPLLALAYYHLFRPQRQTLWSGFGLRVDPRHLGRLGLAVLAVVACGLVGEWAMGRIAEPLNLVSHWTEWFDADLVWGAPSTLAVSLMEYVLFAPVFEAGV